MTTKWASCAAPVIRLPISTLNETEAVLMEDWHLVVLGRELTVPAGTTTDGASIPRFLWMMCGHPLQSPRIYAACAHDYIYRNAKRLGISRKEADKIYKALLRHFGISAWVAGIEYTALRLCGGRNYKGEKK